MILLLLEVRKKIVKEVVTCGRMGDHTFSGANNILFLDLNGGFMSIKYFLPANMFYEHLKIKHIIKNSHNNH